MSYKISPPLIPYQNPRIAYPKMVDLREAFISGFALGILAVVTCGKKYFPGGTAFPFILGSWFASALAGGSRLSIEQKTKQFKQIAKWTVLPPAALLVAMLAAKAIS